jgi:hypothetical protein
VNSCHHATLVAFDHTTTNWLAFGCGQGESRTPWTTAFCDPDQFEQLVTLYGLEKKKLNANVKRALHERSVLFSRNHEYDRRCVHARDTNVASEFETIGRGMRMSRKTTRNFSLARRSAASALLVSEVASNPTGPQDLRDELSRKCMIVYNKDLWKHL